MSSNGPTIALAPPSAQRSLWNRLRRGWKEFALGRPEDELVSSGGGAESSRAILYWCVLGLLMVPPLAGLLVDPHSGWVRGAVLAAVGAGLFAASRLEVERRNRGTFIVPLATGLLVAGAVCAMIWISRGNAASSGVAGLLLVLSLAAVALRDDPRLCITTGLFCMIGYAWIAHEVASEALPGVLPPEWSATPVVGHLAAIACATSFASSAAQRGRALRLQKVRDPATGLMTESALQACLIRETARARAAGRPLSVALVQVQHFSELSERHGRPLAGALLQWMAALLRDRCRATDGLAYLGEGTFAVVFLDSAHPRLQERLSGLSAQVAELEIRQGPEEEPLRVSLRSGLTAFPSEGSEVPELLQLAGRRMRGEAGGSAPAGSLR